MVEGMAVLNGSLIRDVRGRRLARRVVAKARRRIGRADRTAAQDERSQMLALVETFSRRKISGWVAAPKNVLPARVTLRLNDVEVAATWADRPTPRNTFTDARGFRFALSDIWHYCGPGDRLSVHIGDTVVPIARRGVYRRPGSYSELTIVDLQQRFEQGYRFGQTGRLELSKKHDVA
jgi:hypothetical protein